MIIHRKLVREPERIALKGQKWASTWVGVLLWVNETSWPFACSYRALLSLTQAVRCSHLQEGVLLARV